MMSSTSPYLWAPCSCGALVVDADAHALWHARVGDLAPLADAMIADPLTGEPVVPERSDTELTHELNAAQLRQRALNALQNNVDYLALSPPTTAQVVAQVAALTRQNNALIRLAARALDTID